MNPYEIAVEQLSIAAKHLNLEKSTLESLSKPKRELQVNFSVKMDNDQMKVFTGYRVQHNDARGLFKGGIRYHPAVTLDEVRALSMWMKSDGTTPPFLAPANWWAATPPNCATSWRSRAAGWATMLWACTLGGRAERAAGSISCAATTRDVGAAGTGGAEPGSCDGPLSGVKSSPWLPGALSASAASR